MQEPYNYQYLIQQYIDHNISLNAFIETYEDKFLNETVSIGGEKFQLLDWLFAELDGYTTNPELLNSGDNYYKDESAIRKSAEKVLKEIRAL